MTQKQLSQLSIFVVLFMALIIGGYYFSHHNKQKKIESPITEQYESYDTIMANDKFGSNPNAPIDFYTLALSWSPGFCEFQKQRHNGALPKKLAYQCDGKHQFGWVIHGLWPQNAQAHKINEHPRFCQGDLPELPQSTIAPYMEESPGAELLQGEWEKHGACAFDNAQQYFDKQQALYRSLTLPKQAMSKQKLFKWLRAHNPQLRNLFFDSSPNELFICYDLNWQPMNCPKMQYQ